MDSFTDKKRSSLLQILLRGKSGILIKVGQPLKVIYPLKGDTLSICVHPPFLEDLNTMFRLHNLYNVHKISLKAIKLFNQSTEVPSVFKFKCFQPQ